MVSRLVLHVGAGVLQGIDRPVEECFLICESFPLTVCDSSQSDTELELSLCLFRNIGCCPNGRFLVSNGFFVAHQTRIRQTLVVADKAG